MSRIGLSWNRLSILSLVLGIAALAAAAVLFALSYTGVIGGASGNSTIDTVPGFNVETFLQSAPPASPTPLATPPSEAPVVALVIPSINVDAPVSAKGVDGDGVMEAPNGPWDVVWYNFSSRPGFGGNAVFSGHVDYRNVGPAVFYNIKNLNAGDLVEVRLADGTVYQYRVTAKWQFPADDAPVAQIVGPTPNESVTLITCIGTFSRATGQYDQRLVVRAERVAA